MKGHLNFVQLQFKMQLRGGRGKGIEERLNSHPDTLMYIILTRRGRLCGYLPRLIFTPGVEEGRVCSAGVVLPA